MDVVKKHSLNFAPGPLWKKGWKVLFRTRRTSAE
jgi:hypothetical protein